MLLINRGLVCWEESERGSACWGECCSSQREGGCDLVCNCRLSCEESSSAIGIQQPDASSCPFLWLSCCCFWTASPKKTDGFKGWKWMRAYLLLASAWTLSLQADDKSGLKVLWCMCKSPTKVLNSTVYLQWWLISKKQEFTWESLYLMAMCRFCGKWKSWDLRSSTYAEQMSYSKALVLWKQRYGKGMKCLHWSASLFSLLNTYSAEK